jgi:hypothetical protein
MARHDTELKICSVKQAMQTGKQPNLFKSEILITRVVNPLLLQFRLNNLSFLFQITCGIDCGTKGA